MPRSRGVTEGKREKREEAVKTIELYYKQNSSYRVLAIDSVEWENFHKP